MDQLCQADDLHSVGSVGQMIVDAVARHALRVALIEDDREITFAELGRRISQTLRYLEGAGLKRGDVVMQISANNCGVFVLMAACYVGGYVSVTPSYGGSAEDHEYMLDDCGATMLVVDGPRAERAKAFREKRRGVLRILSHNVGTGLDPFWPAVETFEPSALVAADEPSDIVRIIYTGGTTGRPKGVITLSRHLAFASLLHIAEQGFSTRTRMLASSPISHGAGSFIIPVLCKGGSVVIQDGFTADRTLAAVAGLGVTTLFLVPTMLYALMDSPNLAGCDLRSLSRIIYGAAPISRHRLKDALALFGPILTQNYGQTEVPGTVLSLTPEDHADGEERRLGSAGKPYPCVTVALLDGDDRVIAGDGEVGEICVRAPHVTVGYWNKPDQTNELLKGGWLHTGDMAYRDGDGYFHLVDRKKDMLISGGFNIYPREVEDALLSHPAVLNAAVIGIPDPRWGEAVKAIIILRVPSTATDRELIDFVKCKKGYVMAPKVVEFVESLPLTNLGKVDKKALRAPYWNGRDRKVN